MGVISLPFLRILPNEFVTLKTIKYTIMKSFYLTIQARKAFANDENEQIVYAKPFANKVAADLECEVLKESDPTATNEVWEISEDSELFEVYVNDIE